MKKQMDSMKESKSFKRGILVIMVLLLAGGCWWGYNYQQNSEVPELTTFVDSTGTIEVQEEDVPLAKPEVTTKKSSETKKKSVKLKKASKKTYTKNKPTKTKTTTKTTTKGDTKTVVETKVVTKVTEKYKKRSKKKTVITKTTTTVKTTVTQNDESKNSSASVSQTSSQKQNNTSTSTATENNKPSQENTTTKTTKTPQTTSVKTEKKAPETLSVNEIASKADQDVLDAYNTLGFEVTVDSSVSYAGYFSAKNQSIVVKEADDTVYHELGHFVAFVAGNVDTKDAFKAVYEAEKDKFSGVNKAYATQNSSEYFAESYKDYVLNPEELKAERPQTYECVQEAVEKITDSWVARIKIVYSTVWK